MRNAGRELDARERIVLLALGVYVAVALVLLTPVTGAFGGDPPAPPGAPAEAATADTETTGDPAGATDDQAAVADTALPALTSDEQQTASSILAEDRSLATALNGVPYTTVESGPWTTSGANGAAPRILGAAYIVVPQQPLTLQDAPLPGALYDESEATDPPYQSTTNKVSAQNVTRLLVLVDLAKREVVDISPDPQATDVESTPPPDFSRTVPAPTDGGD